MQKSPCSVFYHFWFHTITLFYWEIKRIFWFDFEGKMLITMILSRYLSWIFSCFLLFTYHVLQKYKCFKQLDPSSRSNPSFYVGSLLLNSLLYYYYTCFWMFLCVVYTEIRKYDIMAILLLKYQVYKVWKII